MTGMNPMQIIAMIKNGQNPQQLVLSMLENQMGGTPMGDNLLTMARNGQSADIEKFARNLFESRGMDFDKEFTSFKSQMGFK